MSDHFESTLARLLPKDNLLPLEQFPEVLNAVRGCVLPPCHTSASR